MRSSSNGCHRGLRTANVSWQLILSPGRTGREPALQPAGRGGRAHPRNLGRRRRRPLRRHRHPRTHGPAIRYGVVQFLVSRVVLLPTDSRLRVFRSTSRRHIVLRTRLAPTASPCRCTCPNVLVSHMLPAASHRWRCSGSPSARCINRPRCCPPPGMARSGRSDPALNRPQLPPAPAAPSPLCKAPG